MDKCLWVGTGYPVFIAAVVALWAFVKKKDREVKEGQQALLEEKEKHIRELEEFKRMVENRGKHGSF